MSRPSGSHQGCQTDYSEAQAPFSASSAAGNTAGNKDAGPAGQEALIMPSGQWDPDKCKSLTYWSEMRRRRLLLYHTAGKDKDPWLAIRST